MSHVNDNEILQQFAHLDHVDKAHNEKQQKFEAQAVRKVALE